MQESQKTFIEKYGVNFTEQEYVVNPAIGREKEIRELALVFSRKQMTKPEPAMQFSIREPKDDIPTFMQDVLDYEKTHII